MYVLLLGIGFLAILIIPIAIILYSSMSLMRSAAAIPFEDKFDAESARQLREKLAQLNHELEVAQELGYESASVTDLTRRIAATEILLQFAVQHAETKAPVVVESPALPVPVPVSQKKPAAAPGLVIKLADVKAGSES